MLRFRATTGGMWRAVDIFDLELGVRRPTPDGGDHRPARRSARRPVPAFVAKKETQATPGVMFPPSPLKRRTSPPKKVDMEPHSPTPSLSSLLRHSPSSLPPIFSRSPSLSQFYADPPPRDCATPPPRGLLPSPYSRFPPLSQLLAGSRKLATKKKSSLSRPKKLVKQESLPPSLPSPQKTVKEEPVTPSLLSPPKGFKREFTSSSSPIRSPSISQLLARSRKRKAYLPPVASPSPTSTRLSSPISYPSSPEPTLPLPPASSLPSVSFPSSNGSRPDFTGVEEADRSRVYGAFLAGSSIKLDEHFVADLIRCGLFQEPSPSRGVPGPSSDDEAHNYPYGPEF